MKTLLIIPAYNEEANILATCRSIEQYNEQNGTHYEYVVVNDGSRDRTGEICRKNGLPHVDLIHNLGIGGAVQTGYRYAVRNGYDFAVQFDGDGQHDVACVKDLIRPLEEGAADLVIGSRFCPGEAQDNFRSTAARRAGIRLISFVIRLVTGKTILDTTSGFRACNRMAMNSFARQYPLEFPEPVTNAEALASAWRVREVPVTMHERAGGVSSIRAIKSLYYMFNVILLILLTHTRRRS